MGRPPSSPDASQYVVFTMHYLYGINVAPQTGILSKIRIETPDMRLSVNIL
jgi:hypothetical protein